VIDEALTTVSKQTSAALFIYVLSLSISRPSRYFSDSVDTGRFSQK